MRHSLSPHHQESSTTMTIATSTIVRIVLILGGVAFLWFIRDVIGIVFVAWVVASAIDPFVDKLGRYSIPRSVTILALYLIFFCVISVILYLLVPPLSSQISEIAASFRHFTPEIDRVYQQLTGNTDVTLFSQFQESITSLNAALANFTTSIFDVIANFFGGVAAFVIILVITFYMTIEEDGMKKFIRSFAPVAYQPYLVQKINRIQEKMGGWLRGQLILMVIIGSVSFIGLWMLHVPYALVLALIAGLLEFVPFVGPMMSAIPAVFLAYADSPWKALAVLILFIVLQQLENQVIVPKVMQKAVGLHPIVVLTVMLIGAKVAGIPGILLAVPATTILWIFLEDVFLHKQQMENTLEKPPSS